MVKAPFPRTALSLVIAVATFVAGISLEAVQSPQGEVPAPSAETLKTLKLLKNHRVDLEFDEQPIPDALGFLSMISGLQCVSIEKIEPKGASLTLKLEQISLGSVLALILRQTDSTYRIREGKVVFLRSDEVLDDDIAGPEIPVKEVRKKLRALKKARVALDFDGGKLSEFLKYVQKTSRLNIVLDARVIRKAGVDLSTPIAPFSKETRVLSVIEEQCKALELAVIYKHEAILITTPAEAKKQKESAKRR